MISFICIRNILYYDGRLGIGSGVIDPWQFVFCLHKLKIS